MTKLVSMKKVSLKNNVEITEKVIQDYIFENPEILGLGDLTPVKKEKSQPQGGRLDMLFADDDNNTRYEVELQLGGTDPSHIIRTIEYWDSEKKRYPQYDHCAVIIAEEITGRFMNVISLFNGNIPIIALQVSAYEQNDDISLTFTKILDRVTYATDDEDDFEVTDRAYWEKKATKKTVGMVDKIFSDIHGGAEKYSLKYNKYYIGTAVDGVAKNFIFFKPKKQFLAFMIKCEDEHEIFDKLSNSGIDVTYEANYRRAKIRLYTIEQYEKVKGEIRQLISKKLEENDF